MSVMRSSRVRPSRARRRQHRAMRIHRLLSRELAFEGQYDLLLGRALRRMRETCGYKVLGMGHWKDYVLERVGCEARWAQYLMQLDRVCESRPKLRTALMSGRLTPLKTIHLSRILGKTVSIADDAVIDAATRLSVRELETLARAKKPASAEAENASEASEVPNPWEEKVGNRFEFTGSPRILYLFRAAIEAARRFAGEELPRQACLEYIAADRLSAVGAPPELDRPVTTPVEEKKAPPVAPVLVEPSTEEVEGVEAVEEIEIPVELDANLADSPQALDQIVQWLEARNRGLRMRVAKLLADFQLIDGYRALGYATFNEYCRDELDLDPRRASRLIRFDRGLRRFPEIRAACWAGTLRYLQALLLLRVVTRKTVDAWIKWAVEASVLETSRAVEDVELGGTTYAPRAASEERAEDAPMPPAPGETPKGKPVTIRYRMFLEEDVGRIVMAALQTYRDESGRPRAMGEALGLMCEDFLENLNDPELDALRARFPTLERDGWRCTVPICSGRAYLHPHHIELVSQGGADAEWNKTSLCFVHHLIALHGLLAVLVVFGIAPRNLTWLIGINHKGGPPLLVFKGGRKISSATGPIPAGRRPWKKRPMAKAEAPDLALVGAHA